MNTLLDDPDAMLDVIESQHTEIEHHGAIVKAQVVAAGVRDFLDQAHHVVGEIADGAGDSGGSPGTRTGR